MAEVIEQVSARLNEMKARRVLLVSATVMDGATDTEAHLLELVALQQ